MKGFRKTRHSSQTMGRLCPVLYEPSPRKVLYSAGLEEKTGRETKERSTFPPREDRTEKRVAAVHRLRYECGAFGFWVI